MRVDVQMGNGYKGQGIRTLYVTLIHDYLIDIKQPRVL